MLKKIIVLCLKITIIQILMEKIFSKMPLMPDFSAIKYPFSIFVALLFHVNGAIGMAGIEKDWFVAMTPVNLLVMLVLLIFTEGSRNGRYALFFGLCFMVGMISEIIGVNTGLLFGHYYYGEPMGFKILGVPLLIGIQWFVSVYSSIQVLNLIEKTSKTESFSNPIRAFFAALITTLFDYIIEPAAIKLGFWHWINEEIPFYNYVCWFVISFFLSLFYFNKKTRNLKINTFAVVLFFIQIAFFIYVSKFL